MASRFVMHKDPSFPPVDLIWVDVKTFETMSASKDRTGRHGVRISGERLKELCLRFAGPGVYEEQIEPYL